MGARLYHSDGTWTIADDGGWVPGIYDTRETALAALDVAFGDKRAAFAQMQQRVNSVHEEGRAITMTDLAALS